MIQIEKITQISNNRICLRLQGTTAGYNDHKQWIIESPTKITSLLKLRIISATIHKITDSAEKITTPTKPSY